MKKLQSINDNNVQLDSVSQDIEHLDFLNDFIKVLEGHDNAVLMPHMYSSPRFPGDAVNGAELWTYVNWETEDYYLGQNESSIIARHASDISNYFPIGPTLVDMGPGCQRSIMSKTLPFIISSNFPKAYIPVDLCSQFIDMGVKIVKSYYPALNCVGVQSNFYDCSEGMLKGFAKPVGLFFGCTIANIAEHLHVGAPLKTISNLAKMRSFLGKNSLLVISQDTNQDSKTLKRAYDNPAVRDFTLNVLHRVKRDLCPTGFDPSKFEFQTHWVEKHRFYGRYAVATESQSITLDGRIFKIKKGQKLNIVRSYKYSLDEFKKVARAAGFKPLDVFQDSSSLVAVHVFKAV